MPAGHVAAIHRHPSRRWSAAGSCGTPQKAAAGASHHSGVGQPGSPSVSTPTVAPALRYAVTDTAAVSATCVGGRRGLCPAPREDHRVSRPRSPGRPSPSRHWSWRVSAGTSKLLQRPFVFSPRYHGFVAVAIDTPQSEPGSYGDAPLLRPCLRRGSAGAVIGR